MGISMQGLRAAVIACGLALIGPVTSLAATVDPAERSASAAGAAEPFDLPVSTVSEGLLRDKWLKLARALDDERVQLALCDGDRANCVSEGALQLLAIVDAARRRDGRARLGEINRALNLAIRPMSDLRQYGEIDVWSPPLQTLDRGAGDCEDYAIAKLMALRLAGIAPEDLRLVIMRNVFHGEDHAVAAVRLDGHWLMLDNMRMAMIDDVNVRNYRPLFAIDETGVMRYSAPALLASARARAPSSALPDAPAQPGRIAASE